jgi:hypothetical protein
VKAVIAANEAVPVRPARAQVPTDGASSRRLAALDAKAPSPARGKSL